MKSKNIVKAVATLALVGVVAGALVGCGAPASDGAAPSKTGAKTIKVGASPSPHAEILAQAKSVLADQGYTLEIVEYSDYIQPNVALSEGELDANYFQHTPYLEEYNAENKTDLKPAGEVHFEAMRLYAGKTASVAALKDGAQIAVPSDTTNEARALLLLQDQGIIKLKEGVGLTATANDVIDNPKNIKIVEAEAAALPRTLEDVDLAVINGNYALSAGLDSKLAIASESADSEAAKTYPNVVVVRAADVDSEKTKALVAAIQSDAVKAYIEKTYGDAVVALF
ncbi:MAG: MetQ/NlpA family ABC transporter substrate-binding protein [Eggerthellaceae bacterium]